MRGGIFDRFDIRPVFMDHIRSMRQVGLPSIEGFVPSKPDLWGRVFLYAVPLSTLLASLYFRWRITDPGSITAASALMAGVLFAAFTQLAGLRERLDNRSDVIDEISRRHFRETAAHLMVGSVAAAVEAIIVAIGSGMRNHPDDKLGVIATALALSIGAYVFLLFIMAARRMYSAYLRVFEGGQYLQPSRKTRRFEEEQQDSVV